MMAADGELKECYGVDYSVGSRSLLIHSGSDHLRQVFGKQMGLSDQDIVALSGGHTLVSLPISPTCFFWIVVFMH